MVTPILLPEITNFVRCITFRWLANELDVDVYAYDYSGFGTSTGHASEKNIYYDIEAVYEHILTTRGRQIRVSITVH